MYVCLLLRGPLVQGSPCTKKSVYSGKKLYSVLKDFTIMSRSSIENRQILFEIAESQYGLFTAKQVIEAGFKKSSLSSACGQLGKRIVS